MVLFIVCCYVFWYITAVAAVGTGVTDDGSGIVKLIMFRT